MAVAFHRGLLKDVVSFEVNTAQALGYGALDAYSSFLVTRGWLRKVSGRKVDEFNEVGLNSSWRLRVEFQTALENQINESIRILCNNRIFAVQSYELLEGKKKYYELDLSERERINDA